jgi:hypothetical protein
MPLDVKIQEWVRARELLELASIARDPSTAAAMRTSAFEIMDRLRRDTRGAGETEAAVLARMKV